MKFLVVAQLPTKLSRFLATAGHDSIHSSELPDGNRTADQSLAELADAEGRVVVAKDRDFRDGHLLRRCPRRLLVVATGNITNRALVALFEEHLGMLIELLEEASFVEVGPDHMIAHRSPE